MNIKHTIIILALLVLGGIVGFYSKGTTIINTGSVGITGEYHSTSTGEFISNSSTYSLGIIKNEGGTVGSVVITGTGAGKMNFYDATTTDSTLREVSATSSIQKISIQESTAVGTYTYDAIFKDGIILEIIGAQPTTTITWR